MKTVDDYLDKTIGPLNTNLPIFMGKILAYDATIQWDDDGEIVESEHYRIILKNPISDTKYMWQVTDSHSVLSTWIDMIRPTDYVIIRLHSLTVECVFDKHGRKVDIWS